MWAYKWSFERTSMTDAWFTDTQDIMYVTKPRAALRNNINKFSIFMQKKYL